MLKSLISGLRSLVWGGKEDDWDFSDRRNLIRLRCHYDVEFAHKGKKYQGAVLDMSLKGMKLRGFAPMKPGDEVIVTYSTEILGVEHQSIRCKVLWVRKREKDFIVFSGLGYADDEKTMAGSWVKYLLKVLGFHPDIIKEKRKFVRAECFIPADVVYGHAKKYEGRLYNLGVGGALVETPGALEPESEVELRIGPFEELERFSITGQVVGCRSQGRLHLSGVTFPRLNERNVEMLSKYLIFLLNNHWCE